MTNQTTEKILPRYVADHLGAPFEIVLSKSVKQVLDEDGNILKTVVPNPRGLLRQVAVSRLVHLRKLTGKDIKFIRKALSIKAKELAEMISVTPEHLSRCEADTRAMSPSMEKFLRSSILIDTLKLPDEVEKACENNEVAKRKLAKFKSAFERLQESIRHIQIDAVHDVESPLSIEFFVVDSPNEGEQPDDLEEDWVDNLRAA